MTTEAPPTTTDLPDGVTDTFTATCECDATVQITAGVEQPHDCPFTVAERQAIRDMTAEQFKDNPAAEQAEEPQGIDPLDLAFRLAVDANNRLADRKGGPPSIDRQTALAQAIATVELARWTKAQYALNLQIFQGAVAAQQQRQEAAKGPAGIVVPSMVPRG